VSRAVTVDHLGGAAGCGVSRRWLPRRKVCDTWHHRRLLPRGTTTLLKPLLWSLWWPLPCGRSWWASAADGHGNVLGCRLWLSGRGPCTGVGVVLVMEELPSPFPPSAICASLPPFGCIGVYPNSTSLLI
jgi:hypothetical protein